MRASSAVTPIALVILAGTAVSYAYWVDRGTVSDADRAERRRDVFPTFRVDEVNRVEVAGSDTLVLERDADAGWMMTSPRHERADPASVDVLLREMELATRLRDVRADEAPGLALPRVRGRVSVGPIDYSFAIGADAPTPRDAAYMRVEGEGAFVVGSTLKVQLLRSANAYRDRTLVPYGGGDIARIDVRAGNDGYTLQRVGATFRVGDSSGLRASRQAVERLLSALADARAESFLSDGQVALPSDSVTVTIAPRNAASPRVVFQVGGTCPTAPDDAILVRTEPARESACVARAALDALRTSTASLIDRGPFFARADEMEEIRLEPVGTPGLRVDVARLGTGWKERAPQARELAGDAADALNALAGALADATAFDATRSSDRLVPAHRVTIVRTGGGSSEVLDIGAPGPDGTALARRADDGAILRLSHATTRRLQPEAVLFRPLALWSTAFDPATVTAVDDTCGPTPQRAELRGGTWTFRAPAGLAVDAIAMEGLAEAVAHAKATAWVSEEDDGSFGFHGPGSCALTVVLGDSSSGAGRHAGVEFGMLGEGGVYARVTGVGARPVAVLPRALLDVASRPAIDGSRLKVDTNTLDLVVVGRAGSKVRLSRSGTDLVRSPPVDAESGPAIHLEGALEGLSALYAVHAGPAAHDEGFDQPTLTIDESSRDDGGAPTETLVTIGAMTGAGATDAYYARVSGINATFAVSRRAADAIASSL